MSPRLILSFALLLLIGVALYWTFNPPPADKVGESTNGPLNPDIAADGGPGRAADGNAKSNNGNGQSSHEKGLSKGKAANDNQSGGNEPTASAPKPLLAGWEKPRAVLVFSGEQHGYVEPCGCSLKQLGGISRRADLFRQLTDRGFATGAFDLGGLVNRPARKQAKMKLQLSLQALQDMKYSAVAFGPEELRQGIELVTFDARPPFLASNIVLGGDPDLGVVSKSLVIEVGDLKVGVTAVYGKSFITEVLSQINAAEVEVLDPIESLKKVLPELEEQKPDLLVLLVHARNEEAKAIGSEFPQLDLIAATGGPEDPHPRPTMRDKTMWVWPGQKGKFVSVVGVFSGESPDRLRYEAVALDEDRFQETPAMREHMQHYQTLLEVNRLVENEPAIGHPRNAAESATNEFVGAVACGECHKKAFEHWQTTGHARGTISLRQGRPGQESNYISRLYDPECVACHVTGWDPKEAVRYRSGWTDANATPHLEAQQCENCHGPGGRHAELERLFAKNKADADERELEHWREFVQLSVDTAFDMCARCHDGDNDPHFHTPTFPEYWEKIKHPWRD